MMTLKKRVFSIIALVLFIVFICPLYILPVSASNEDFIFEMSVGTPSISDNNGYIEILFYNNVSDVYFVRTYAWFTNPIGIDIDQTFCEVTCNDTSVTLAPGFHIYDTTHLDTNTYGARLSYFYCTSSGYTGASAFDQYYGHPNSITISVENCTIKGIHFYGNYRLLSTYSGSTPFKVLYSAEDVTFIQLISIFDVLYSSYNLDLECRDYLDSLLESNLTIEEKLSTVINYLEDIDLGIDSLNDKLNDVINNTDDIESKLDKIIEILESNIDTDVPTDVSKDSLNDYNKFEDDLISSIAPNDDLLDDFSFESNFSDFFNGDSFALTWNLIECAFSTHDYIIFVFSIVIVLGIICLILNR